MATATKTAPELRTRKEVEREIKDTLGIVPHFFERIPDDLIDLEWSTFKRIELEERLIPNKYKQLMGVALHSETKCRYCTLFHTEMARLHGATEEELQEAVHYAKSSVGWSVYMNGLREDEDRFEKDLRQAIDHVQKGGAKSKAKAR